MVFVPLSGYRGPAQLTHNMNHRTGHLHFKGQEPKDQLLGAKEELFHSLLPAVGPPLRGAVAQVAQITWRLAPSVGGSHGDRLKTPCPAGKRAILSSHRRDTRWHATVPKVISLTSRDAQKGLGCPDPDLSHFAPTAPPPSAPPALPERHRRDEGRRLRARRAPESSARRKSQGSWPAFAVTHDKCQTLLIASFA